MTSSFEEISPAGYAWAATASDSAELIKRTRAIYIGGDGSVACEVFDPTTQKLGAVTFVGLVAGTVLPVRTKKILSTGTTATNIVALA